MRACVRACVRAHACVPCWQYYEECTRPGKEVEACAARIANGTLDDKYSMLVYDIRHYARRVIR